MRPRIPHIVSAALVLVLCRAAADQSVARVILDRPGDRSNPSVDAGGRHLPPRPPVIVPYSLIGAISSEGRWLDQCAIWPWGLPGTLAFDHHASARGPVSIQPERGRISPWLP